MITFLALGERGRLGNQLFQYAALRSLGLRQNYEVKIPRPSSKNWHGQQCLLDKFNIKAVSLEDSDLSSITRMYSEPDYMTFDNNFFHLPDNLNLDGFFQSTFYFKEFERDIKEELTPKDEFLLKAKEEILKIKKDTGYDIVSLHLRRGDNTDNSNPSDELNSMYGSNNVFSHDSFYGKYLKNAMNQFKGKRVKFLVFTGGARFTDDNSSDVEWCKKNLAGDEFIYSEGQSSMGDFCKIMSCDHNILSHVSSFGWWAAYLNSNKGRVTVAPERYHPDRQDLTYREGFFPKEWVLV
jgi:hypothetical protein